jgi:Xaa-Pro aminopeptidase
MFDYSQRLAIVQQRMLEQGIDLLFLPRSANLHYLTGIPREEPNYGNVIHPGEWMTGAWITPHRPPVITVSRMTAEFYLDVMEYEVRVLPDEANPFQLAQEVLNDLHIPERGTIAIEDRAWAETILNLRRLRPDAQWRLASTILMPLRSVKGEDEITILRRAGEITEAAYAAVLQRIRSGMTTLDLITEVNYQLRLHGAHGSSFATSFYNMGPHFPFDFHHREETLRLPLEPPLAISFDFGAVYEGYCYDFGRSVFLGEPDTEYRQVYELAMAAQRAGIEALWAGNTCEIVDAAARQVITQGGYGEAFRHRLGHGIGMDVHEPPFLTAGDQTRLQAGMCFTVEPSIFIPHRFGARVEDVIVVRENGGEPLTSGYQDLYVIE